MRHFNGKSQGLEELHNGRGVCEDERYFQ
jgi:hypothetical protein